MTNPTRSTRYLVALVDGGGTVPPELGVVRRLLERGHEVTVLAEDSMVEEVQATGAVVRCWEHGLNRASRSAEDDPYRDWECRTPFQLFDRILDRQFLGPAAGYARDVLAAIDDDRPDRVLCSFFALGAMAAAESATVPFDILMPNVYFLPVPGRPPFGLGLQPATGPLSRTRDRFITGLTLRQWNKGVPRLNEFRSDLGLPLVGAFFDQMARADRHLVLTSSDFDFPGELPDQVRYVGPVLDDPHWAATNPWTPPPGADPLVLVALSSTFQDQLGCLQRIVDAMGELPVRGVVTTGPALDPASIHAPANVVVVAAAPHSEVLGHAAAVVTHGGHGTVVRALAADVPLVVMAHGRDQADNAARVTARGAGIALKRSSSSKRIARAVQQVLDNPAYREGAARLGASVRRDADDGAIIAALEEETVGAPLGR